MNTKIPTGGNEDVIPKKNNENNMDNQEKR